MLRVPIDLLREGERELDDATARYVTRVHRLGRDACFTAFDPDVALEAEVRILSIEARVRIAVGEPRPSRNVPTRRTTVIQAASKGTKIEDVLRDATELGVTRFVVAMSERSVRRPEPSQHARWRRVAVEAARQSGRGDVPEIVGPVSLSAALGEPGELRWLLDPAGRQARELRPSTTTSAVVAIGPEGGFAPAELALADRASFERVRLGRFVLRTETACAAVLGAIEALSNDDDDG
ncbi:MAG: 16S rRNA (uracil(1498)-N(3))-methyltransferase [Deltaproteobacteria bacterium]|nr:16S rRNA (uracil(1498)-N(3))-methyltransferase [Deltaproteobacteria bacterium]